MCLIQMKTCQFKHAEQYNMMHTGTNLVLYLLPYTTLPRANFMLYLINLGVLNVIALYFCYETVSCKMEESRTRAMLGLST